MEIPNSKKVAKQELIYKILDAQSLRPVAAETPISKTRINHEEKKENMDESPKKRPRVKRENVKEIENSVETKK